LELILDSVSLRVDIQRVAEESEKQFLMAKPNSCPAIHVGAKAPTLDAKHIFRKRTKTGADVKTHLGQAGQRYKRRPASERGASQA
jgi:hypothetical protein